MSTLSQASSQLRNAILSGKKDLSLSLFENALQTDETRFINELRKKGVLRCSNYDFKTSVISHIVNQPVQAKISQSSRIYLSSIKSLLAVSRNIELIFRSLVKEAASHDIKSYLASIDTLFWEMNEASFYHFSNKSISKEDLACAFSMYFYYARKYACGNQGFTGLKLDRVNEKLLRNGYYIKRLKDFSKIIFYKECEILVDYFGYIATQVDSKVILEAPYEALEMSLRLGYIKQSTQEIANSIEFLFLYKSNSLSINQFSKEFYERFNESIFRVVDKPLKRIVMHFPKNSALINFLMDSNIFLEETLLIEQIKNDFFIDFGKFSLVKIYKNLSLLDILRAQRLFIFLFLLFENYVSERRICKDKIFWRSMLPVFEESEFKKLLSDFLGELKSNELLELLSWDSDSGKIFDLQTYPFVSLGKWVVLPLGVLSRSNLCRNALQSTRYRYDSESDDDPIVEAMEQYLKPVSSMFQTNLNYSFENIKGEIDIFAILGNYLFVFECKNSLHPCGLFELRTTFDYIRKAADQLSRFKALYLKEPFKKYLSKRMNLPLSQLPEEICTCIISGNRMFPGLREQGHPVRTVHELINIIATGEFSLGMYANQGGLWEQKGVRIKFWKGDKFNFEDLFRYINKDLVHQCIFDSMKKYDLEVGIQGKSIIQRSFVLDMESLAEKFVTNFEFEEFSVNI